MAGFKILLYKSKRSERKDGSYPVCLRVTKNGKIKYISLKLHALENQWDDGASRYKSDKRLTSSCKEYNALLSRYEARVSEIERKFDEDCIDWTLNQFEERFKGYAKRGKVLEYLHRHIQVLQDTGHTGNSNCYTQLSHMLELFDKKLKDRVFSEVDIKYVKSFDVFLQKRGCVGNTRKYYLKSLRAVLNKAIQDNEASQHTYPFGKGGFEINSLEEETDKRYLSEEDLEKIKTGALNSETGEYTRKLFLFSYYSFGMSFIDMAYLTWKNVKEMNSHEYIVYKRQKIKHQKNVKPIQIPLTENLKMILEWFRDNTLLTGDYLLPIVSRDYTGEALYKHIRDRYRRYSKNLKAMAEELGITSINLTSYVSRHTMAMTLQNKEVQREVISQVLGHKDLTTTNVYLDSFKTDVIDKTAKLL
ncbi:MAG: recombinase [Butyricimonas synergistica]|nr:MAG: recombinase [Butyricimonas synergistica]